MKVAVAITFRVVVRVQDNVFTYRVAKMRNDLPADSTDYSILTSLNSFKRSLNSKVLVQHSKVYFLVFIDCFISRPTIDFSF